MVDENDPVEQTADYRAIIAEAENTIKSELSRRGFPTKAEFVGWCHIYWGIKKEVLLRDYGIVWKSPAELNPQVRYD